MRVCDVRSCDLCVSSNVRLQLRRLIIPSAAVGCKPVLASKPRDVPHRETCRSHYRPAFRPTGNQLSGSMKAEQSKAARFRLPP